MAQEEQPKQTVTVTGSSEQFGDLSRFYLSETFSDVVFHLNGQKHHAHKIILATKCKYFDILLLKDPKQCEYALEDISSNAFLNILEYIYTGSIEIVPSEYELVLDLMKLANDYSLTSLINLLIENITSIINVDIVCALLNQANNNNIVELTKVCHKFIDEHASEMTGKEFFNCLSQESMVKVIERDSFVLPEIDIFRIVANWCEKNDDEEDLVKNCVRLFLLDIKDILNIVCPSKLINESKLLSVITAIENSKIPEQKTRLVKKIMGHKSLSCIDQDQLKTDGKLVKDKNIDTARYNVKLISGNNRDWLFKNNSHQWATHSEGDANGITVDLGALFCFNHITMTIIRNSYYVETSQDLQQWNRIIDYSDYTYGCCQNHQNLYFESQTSRYVRIVATEYYLRVKNLKLYFKSSIPPVRNQIVCPTSDVGTGVMGATLENNCLGDLNLWLAQPYMISCIKLRLPPSIDQYVIQTNSGATDGQWEVLKELKIEKHSDWQTITFNEKIVLGIFITGGDQQSLTDSFSIQDVECFYHEK